MKLVFCIFKFQIVYVVLTIGPLKRELFSVIGSYDRALQEVHRFRKIVSRIVGKISSNRDYGITPLLKLGLRDYAPFEIGIMGLQDPP